jgi:hypothetical protein
VVDLSPFTAPSMHTVLHVQCMRFVKDEKEAAFALLPSTYQIKGQRLGMDREGSVPAVARTQW